MEYLSIGLATAVIGFFAVTAGLLIIMICIYALGIFTQSKEAHPNHASLNPIKSEFAPITENDPQICNPELAAVITAAIRAYTGTNSGLVVRSFKRTQTWNDAARLERHKCSKWRSS